MLCENVGLETSLESLPPAGVSYLKENRATMSSSKEKRNSRPQAYSCCVPESESRTFTNGVCEPWKLNEAEQFYLPFFYLHISVRQNHSPSTARGSLCLLDQGPLPAAPGTLRPAQTGPTRPTEHRSPAGSGSSSCSGTVGWRCWSACWRRESRLFSEGYDMSLFNIWSSAIKMCPTLLQKRNVYSC